MIAQEFAKTPDFVKEVESLVLYATCNYLCRHEPRLSLHQIEFLSSPWVHFFTHSILSYLEIHGSPMATGLTETPSKSLTIERSAPGDTFSFYDFSRSPAYREYLDLTFSGKEANFIGRSEIHTFPDEFPSSVTTVAFSSCLPRKFRYLLRLLSLGKVRHLRVTPCALPVAADWCLRQGLSEQIQSALVNRIPQSAQWIGARAKELFPKSLLENLSVSLSSKWTLPSRKFLFSADGWQIIDDWKIYSLAQKIRSEAKWIGAPNALGHGCLAVFWQREFEIRHLDTYLTWGWTREGKTLANVVPFYAPHFAGQRQAKPSRTDRREGILVSSADRPRHLMEYPYTTAKFEKYLDIQLDMAVQVQGLTNASVTIRSRSRDPGWDLDSWVRSAKNSKITLECQNGNFLARLEKSWIHICDNFSTTIAESLWANHPTLIVITSEYFRLAPNATNEFGGLADAGVFHTSPESLLSHLGKIQDDVASWWASHKVQEAVRGFLRAQCRDGSTVAIWRSALLGRYVPPSNA
jgi:hypothetical protein